MNDHTLSLSAHLLLWVFPVLLASATIAHAALHSRTRRGPR